MISTLFRIAATPLAVALDHMMTPGRMRDFYDYVDEYGDDLYPSDHREVS